jgi:hypothetical protein
MQVVGQFRFKGMELSMKMSGVVVWPSRICWCNRPLQNGLKKRAQGKTSGV